MSVKLIINILSIFFTALITAVVSIITKQKTGATFFETLLFTLIITFVTFCLAELVIKLLGVSKLKMKVITYQTVTFIIMFALIAVWLKALLEVLVLFLYCQFLGLTPYFRFKLINFMQKKE